VDEQLNVADIIEHPTPAQVREAWRIFRKELRAGRITKPTTCSWCGVTPKRLHGHHPDYARPLMVVWVCPSCHSKHHVEYRVEALLARDGF